jgi:hypothetical protein
MEWVAVAVNIARDPAVHRMAAAIRVRVPEIVGLLALTFAEMTQHAPDGQLADVPDTLLESWAGWHGRRGAFAAQFRAELCDDAGLVTAWERYNGAAIRRARAARERTRAWRKEREQASRSADGASISASTGTHTGTHTDTASVRGTGQDRTGPDQQQQSPPRATSLAEVQLAEQCGPEHYPAVADFLDERPAHLRAEWAKDLLKYIGPATGNLPVDLARAATDGKLATPPVTNAQTLRIFLAGCRRERVHGTNGGATNGTPPLTRGRPSRQEAGRAGLAQWLSTDPAPKDPPHGQ